MLGNLAPGLSAAPKAAAGVVAAVVLLLLLAAVGEADLLVVTVMVEAHGSSSSTGGADSQVGNRGPASEPTGANTINAHWRAMCSCRCRFPPKQQ